MALRDAKKRLNGETSIGFTSLNSCFSLRECCTATRNVSLTFCMEIPSKKKTKTLKVAIFARLLPDWMKEEQKPFLTRTTDSPTAVVAAAANDSTKYL